MSKMQQMLLRAAERVYMEDRLVQANALSPADADAAFVIASSGIAQQSLNSGFPSTLFTWLLQGAAADYDVRATVQSGTLSGGTAGVWLNCGTGRSWSRNRTQDTDGTTTCVILVELAAAGTTTPLASGVITLRATVIV